MDLFLGKTIQTIALILANPPAVTETNRTTLIVCPLSVIQSWQSQITQHVKPRTLKVAVYQGPSRYDLLEESAAEGPWDVLIAPYGTVRADFEMETLKGKGAKKKAKTGPSIYSKTFHRVVLDEAHQIRNPKAKQYLACKELKTMYRLCLTGTPIQNKPVDIQSLFGFLQVPNLGDAGIFRRAITQPIQAGDPVGFARLRTTMAHLSLRRTKDCLDLVEKTVELRKVEFGSSPHSRIHDILFNSVKHVFSAMEDTTAMKNYMMILEALTRIRQACVSGCLVPKERIELAEKVLDELQQKGSTLSPADAEKILMKLKGAFSEDLVECSICFEEMEESTAAMLRTCHHVFCEGCLTTVSNQSMRKCPLCRTGFVPADMIKKSTALEASQSSVQDKSEKASETLTALGPSPKLLALEAAIKEMSNGERGVIFSQFTTFLDLVGPHLEKLGYTYARIDGKKTGKQRAQALTLFATADGPDFMLCSLHAAGTGITLTAANHCFMMDTWWNVSVELQAQDRIHRIGQTRPVRVVRFVMKDSIEERMIALQESKAAMSKGAMQKLSSAELRKTRIRDLKSLFGETDD
jgi:SWI/SNF-related matrix-associated actin-dependent regulator of chromatin subfamily A3